jgi:hypothetical protein
VHEVKGKTVKFGLVNVKLTAADNPEANSAASSRKWRNTAR